MVSVGFFATRDGVAAAYPNTPLTDWGVLYGGSGAQLGVQLLGAVALGVFTLALNGAGFFTLRSLGCLRVPKEVRHARYMYTFLQPFCNTGAESTQISLLMFV